MIRLNYKNTDEMVIGKENGLNIQKEFAAYKDTIAKIITDLNKRKDKPEQWLQWMNLGYNEETIWYIKEFASQVKENLKIFWFLVSAVLHWAALLLLKLF